MDADHSLLQLADSQARARTNGMHSEAACLRATTGLSATRRASLGLRRQYWSSMLQSWSPPGSPRGPALSKWDSTSALWESGEGHRKFVAQQYAGRYALELLQNADDAASDRGVAGRVRFVVGERSLIVADNGTGFGPDQVRALCTLGDSSKDRSKSIGYKGIGFKSVLEITDIPQIFSADVAFGFDEARTRMELARILGDQQVAEVPIPAYAFPIALAPSEAGLDASIVARLREDGYTTVVRIPLKETLTLGRIVETLTATITPRLLLLLQGLEELVVEGATDFVATLLRESLGTCTRCILEMGGGALEEWLVYRRSHVLGPNDPRPNDPQWRRTTAISTAVAVRIVADEPCPTSQPLHVYFPTEDRCGYPLILHADWALDPDRRHLARSADFEAYNELVTRAFALKRHGLTGSMGRVGACGDNAAMESFFALLQKNVLDRRSWGTREELRLAIVSWIEGKYHRKRRQRRLGKLTPVEFELIMKPTATLAA